jgi:hypothetical protein
VEIEGAKRRENTSEVLKNEAQKSPQAKVYLLLWVRQTERTAGNDPLQLLWQVFESILWPFWQKCKYFSLSMGLCGEKLLFYFFVCLFDKPHGFAFNPLASSVSCATGKY